MGATASLASLGSGGDDHFSQYLKKTDVWGELQGLLREAASLDHPDPLLFVADAIWRDRRVEKKLANADVFRTLSKFQTAMAAGTDAHDAVPLGVRRGRGRLDHHLRRLLRRLRAAACTSRAGRPARRASRRRGAAFESVREPLRRACAQRPFSS